MNPEAITTTVLSHPLQFVLVGMILLHGVRAAISAIVEGRKARRPAPAARPFHLQAA
jgi:hypothetical protein